MFLLRCLNTEICVALLFSSQPCYPWLESDTPVASTVVSLFADCIKLLHESFKGEHEILSLPTCWFGGKKKTKKPKSLECIFFLWVYFSVICNFSVFKNILSSEINFYLNFFLLLIWLSSLILEKLLPSHHGALWLHLMHYCECCTAPKMPEFILYSFHTEFRRLPWKEMHPDQMLMEEFFKVSLWHLLNEVHSQWCPWRLLESRTQLFYQAGF